MTPARRALRLYIAGPMTRRPAFNFPAFFAAEDELERAGYSPISPARRDVEGGFTTEGLTGYEDLAAVGFDRGEALAWDLTQVTTVADGVALLPGWEDSSGARAEVAAAAAVGVPVKTVEEWVQDAQGTVASGTAPAETVTDMGRHLSYASSISIPSIAGTPGVLPSGEVRVTSTTGGAKGRKLAAFDMIPTDSLWELAEHYGKGAEKYEPVNGVDNWRNGYPWSLSFAAAFRHLTLAMGGEDIDEETGSKHIIAAAWHMLGLAHFMNNPRLREQFDDRQAVRERATQTAS